MFVFVCMYVFVRVCVHMCMCVCTCMFVYLIDSAPHHFLFPCRMRSKNWTSNARAPSSASASVISDGGCLLTLCRYLKLQSQSDAAALAAVDNAVRYTGVGGDIRHSLSVKTAQFAQTVRRCVSGTKMQLIACSCMLSQCSPSLACTVRSRARRAGHRFLCSCDPKVARLRHAIARGVSAPMKSGNSDLTANHNKERGILTRMTNYDRAGPSKK